MLNVVALEVPGVHLGAIWMPFGMSESVRKGVPKPADFCIGFGGGPKGRQDPTAGAPREAPLGLRRAAGEV